LYYEGKQDSSGLLLTFTAFLLSFMVSYTRARAEGLGIACEIGVLPRPGRVILLAMGLIFDRLSWALAGVASLSLITFFQRIHRVWTQAKRPSRH